MRVEYHPATVTDLKEAVEYYETWREGLGEDLRTEIYRTIEQVAKSPERYPLVRNSIRRCFVKRFPFSVLYRILDDEVVRILVIRHHRQHPSIGLRRR